MIPEISIITCNFNHAKWIERCIRSVQNQLNFNSKLIEHIIVDDCSSDNSIEVISKYSKNVKLIKNKDNIGLPSSINKAIKVSKGRYIMRLDSDDYLSRLFVQIHCLYLDHNRHFDAVSSDYLLVDNDENFIKREFSKNVFIACGILFRREVLFELGLYNSNFKYREGHELMKRFNKNKFRMGYSNYPLYKYRKHDTNRTKNMKRLKKYNQMLKRKKNS